MDLEQINKILDSETIIQTNIFGHTIPEYEEIYKLLGDMDKNDRDFQQLHKKVKNLDKPFAKFVKSVIDLSLDKSDDKTIRSLEEKSYKSNKYDYALFFANVAIDFNDQDLYALDLICIVLKKNNVSTLEQKQAIEKYLDQDLLDTHYLLELSKIHLQEEKKDNAIIDLKKAVQRAIKKSSPQELKICSVSLDELLESKDKIYLISTLSRATKTIDKDKICSILLELERRNHDDLDYSIKLLKEILKNDTENSKARQNLVDQYKTLYNESERSLFCIKSSGLLDDKINVLQAINKFEKIVQIEQKVFVNHSTFGLGRITNVDSQFVTIDFIEKRNHKMSIEMANNSLTILDKNNILVLKTFANRDKLRQRFLDDPRWGLTILIKSGFNTLKLMKNELVPDILKPVEFTKFQNTVRDIIKQDNYISTVINKNDEFEVRNTPISYEEKTYRQFKNENNIYSKIKTVRLFLQAEGDQASESFQNMLQYFINFLKSRDINKNFFVSYLFLQELMKGKFKITDIQKHLYYTEEEVFKGMSEDDYIEYYCDVQDSDIKKDTVDGIRKYDSNWKKTLEECYTKQPYSYITKIFAKDGDAQFEKKMMKKSIFLAKQLPDLFLYFLKMYPEFNEWKTICQNDFELISIQLDILHTFSKIPGTKFIQQNLIDSNRLNDFISKNNDISTLTMLYWTIDRNQNIDDMVKAKLKKSIAQKYPDIEKSKNDNEADMLPKKLLCKKSSYEKKQKEYDNLVNVEIPKNARDIASARELGDLRENSEYQYAKDKQKFLNASVSIMEEEISKAYIVKQEEIDTSKISFGCEVEIQNKDNTISKYTVLGPWESDADNNIISFNSPLGKKLYYHTTGENLIFDLNDTHYDFVIKSIKSVDVS